MSEQMKSPACREQAGPQTDLSTGAEQANKMYTDDSQKATVWPRTIAPSGFINVVTAYAEKFGATVQTRTFIDDEAMQAYIDAEHGKGREVYWQPNECDDRDYPGARPTKDDVTSIRVLHLDLDFKDYFGANREPSQAEKDALFQRLLRGQGLGPNGEDVPPTAIVASGGGFHVYWVLAEPLPKTDATTACVESINANIAKVYRAGKGTQDISRLLRVAGTTNFKPERNRAKVLDCGGSGKRYSLNDFAQLSGLPLDKKKVEHKHEGKEPVYLDDLHELGLDVSQHADTLALICWPPDAGCSLDNRDKQYLLSPDKRSERVKSVVERLILAKIPSEIIVGVISDERWPVSAHVLDNGGVPYAWRQLRDHAPEELVYEPTLVSLTPIPDDLPPMPSLVQGLLIDGAVTVLGGRGGVGKSLLQIHTAVGVTLGLPTLHWPAPREPRRVLMLNSEDDTREKQHRLWAVCRQMGVEPADLTGKLFTLTQTRIELFQATFDEKGKRQIETTPFYERLKKLIKEQSIGLLIVDPMAELHVGLDENSNMEMKEVMIGLRVMAQELAIPVMVAHHTRKGYAADGQEQDAFRGAGAIINAARVAVLMESLKKEDAANLIGKNEKREDFVVVSDAKQNYFAKEAARMVKFVTHLHPTAGVRAALVKAEIEELPPDTPPEALPEREAILDLLRERRDTGNRPFYTNAKAKKDGRLDAAIMEVVGLSKNATATAIKVLERSGLIVRTRWETPNRETVEVWRLGKEEAGFEFEDIPF